MTQLQRVKVNNTVESGAFPATLGTLALYASVKYPYLGVNLLITFKVVECGAFLRNASVF